MYMYMTCEVYIVTLNCTQQHWWLTEVTAICQKEINFSESMTSEQSPNLVFTLYSLVFFVLLIDRLIDWLIYLCIYFFFNFFYLYIYFFFIYFSYFFFF